MVASYSILQMKLTLALLILLSGSKCPQGNTLIVRPSVSYWNASTYPVAGALWAATPDGLLGLPVVVLSSLPAPSSHLQRLPSSLVGAKVSLICIGTTMMSLNPVFVEMSVLSRISVSVRLFQVLNFSFSRACKPHYCKTTNSSAYQRLSAKVKQSNGFRDNDRTEFLQNATQGSLSKCAQLGGLHFQLLVKYKLIGSSNHQQAKLLQEWPSNAILYQIPCCYQSNYAQLVSLLWEDIN